MKRRDFHLTLIRAACALPLIEPSVVFATEATLRFDELYAKQSVLGLELSTKAKSLDGRSVRILGYLAPPLKPEVKFFVLTRAPVALCPFCNSDADWPSDIVVVYPREGLRSTQDGLPVAVTGKLELGSRIDPDTGFVSLVRVVDAECALVR
ncbi:MAG TPA: hypothetical protein VMV45_16125 [Casimicrobiaceae bacterium]|nr:hypothetical protein [Casimicrobiaceae bacterium]